MPGRVQDAECPYRIPFREHDIRHDAGCTGAEMHREAAHLIEKSRRIGSMDGNLRLAHVGDLFYVSGMVKVAVRQDYRVDGGTVRFHCHGRYTCIDKNAPVNVRIGIEISLGNPLDLHAQ
jgi:hypothetical protein